MSHPDAACAAGRSRAGRGQSLVEFAILLPILLLLALIAVDFGRALYGWVILQNSARIGANFAGLYPNGWRDSDPGIQAEYETLIERDLATANCVSPSTPPAPTFTDGPDFFVVGGNPDTAYDVGDTVRVALTCDFRPLTPIISAITGEVVHLGADADFRIRAGDIAGLAHATHVPPPSSASPPPVGSPAPSQAGCVSNPVANFSGTPTSGSGGSLSVAFTSTSTAVTGCTITSWSWTFGDGQTSTQQNPIHLYTKTGPGSQQRFDVTLTVRQATGQTDVEARNNYVTVSR